MRTTIDAAGRLVIPKAMRDRVGLGKGEVEIEADGADIRIRAVAADTLVQRDGWLVIPASGSVITTEMIRDLRDADQR